ncbi:MAG: hypothetical protein HY337_02760 [Gemmatimonadetes bacterium]|nr:hypothetical protein [Gemmatimonadota bacterium]
MRRPRLWRLLAAALGFAVVMANPAWGLAHALAHHHDDRDAHHLQSLESHDGPTELSTPGHADGHQHARIDRATRTTPHHLVLGPPVTETAADLAFAPSARVGDVLGSSIEVPDPPGDAPPRLRAPPLY